MKVIRTQHSGHAVLKLEGEFDSFETDLVRENFEACVEEGCHKVILDLADLTFANSTTIAYFITAQKRAKSLGGRVVLARPNEFLRKTLKTLGLDQVFTIEAGLDEAATALKA